MKILKSIGAVLAGFVTVFVLSVATDKIVEALGFFPPPTQPEAYVWWMLLIALLYRCIITVLGGYVTARLAPSRPMRHAIILGIIGTVGGTIGAVTAWHLGNHWYPIALAITALPCTWWGGRIFVGRTHMVGQHQV